MLRFLRDGFIAILVDTTVRFFIPSLVPLLPLAWVAILAWLTVDLINSKHLKQAVERAYSATTKRSRVAAYIIIFIIGGTLLCFYFWAVNESFAWFRSTHRSLDVSQASATPPQPPPEPSVAISSEVKSSPDQPKGATAVFARGGHLHLTTGKIQNFPTAFDTGGTAQVDAQVGEIIGPSGEHKEETGLNGEFENIITGPVKDGRTIVFVLLCLRNNGPETIAEDYQLHMVSPDNTKLSAESVMIKDAGVSIDGRVLTLKESDYLPEKTLTPIKSGGLVRGWTAFLISGLKEENFIREGVETSLTFRDLKQTYTIKAPPYGSAGPKLQYRPGISLEWKDEKDAGPELNH